jgi:hypothetical protein
MGEQNVSNQLDGCGTDSPKILIDFFIFISYGKNAQQYSNFIVNQHTLLSAECNLIIYLILINKKFFKKFFKIVLGIAFFKKRKSSS